MFLENVLLSPLHLCTLCSLSIFKGPSLLAIYFVISIKTSGISLKIPCLRKLPLKSPRLGEAPITRFHSNLWLFCASIIILMKLNMFTCIFFTFWELVWFLFLYHFIFSISSSVVLMVRAHKYFLNESVNDDKWPGLQEGTTHLRGHDDKSGWRRLQEPDPEGP